MFEFGPATAEHLLPEMNAAAVHRFLCLLTTSSLKPARVPVCPDGASCAFAGVKAVCNEYKIHNADITMRDDCDIDDLVDVIEGSRVYIPCIYAVNKIVRKLV